MATPTTLPASFTTGAVLTAAQMNDLRGAFRVLQVLQGNTTSQVANSGTSYIDTGASVTITPSSTSSKILVVASTAIYMATADCTVYVQLLRGATQIGLSVQNDSTSANAHQTSVIVYLDSPNTTSATTYKTQFKNNNASKDSYVSNSSTMTSVTVLEISA
jgi:hypothetical protein